MLTRKSLVVAALSFAFFAAPAQAQAIRTWVSGVGDDANPCSRTAPCKTFAGAISKTAAGGLISVLDPGGYGAVTITKAITIDGGEETGSILYSGVSGVIVNIASPAADDVVVLRNLNLSGAGTLAGISGIRVISAAAVHVENCVIDTFNNRGIVVENTTDVRLFVRDTVVRNAVGSGGGIEIKPAVGAFADAVLENVQVFRGLFGIRVENRVGAVLKGCTIASNTNNGVLAYSTTADGAEIELVDCLVTQNGLAGVKSEGANTTIRISGTTVTSNGTGLLPASSGKILSYGNNRVAGNGTDGAPTGTIAPK